MNDPNLIVDYDLESVSAKIQKFASENAINLPYETEWPTKVTKENLHQLEELYEKIRQLWLKVLMPVLSNSMPDVRPTEPNWNLLIQKKIESGGEVNKIMIPIEQIISRETSGMDIRINPILGVIRKLGIDQATKRLPPVVVKKAEENYEVIDGNTRVKAAKLFFAKEIPGYLI